MDAAKPAETSVKGPEHKENKVVKAMTFYFREIVAIGFWSLLFIKAFVFDIDLALIKFSPALFLLYPYKFFILLATLALSWVSLGTKRFLKTVGYVAIYPFIVILWKIPKLLFKNWALLVIFAPAIESTLFTLKWRFAFATIAILAGLAILNFQIKAVLVGAMAFLILYLLVHYMTRLKVAFKPTAVFANIADVVQELWRAQIEHYERKHSEAHSGAQGELYENIIIENLKTLYLQNLTWRFFATKLNQTISTRRTDLYFIIAVLYSVLLTVLIFGFVYFGLYKLDPNSFHRADDAGIWSFLVFSFNTIMHTGFTRIVPNSDWAFALGNFELLAGIVTLILFVYVLMTSSKERYREDFRRVVRGLDQSSKQIERFFEKRLKMRLVDAEAKIIEHDPTFRETIKGFGRMPALIDVEPVPSNQKSGAQSNNQESEEANK